MQKLPKIKSGAGASTSANSNWAQFLSLSFLRPQFQPRKTTDNLVEESEFIGYLEQIDTYDVSLQDSAEFLEIIEEEEPAPPMRQKEKGQKNPMWIMLAQP